METFLDRLHARARASGPLRRLAIISRILLALAFIPTGMVKLLGHRFTLMSPDTAVGGFFEAMYQTGFYWNFLGLAQVMAGVLLLVPWTTTLGAAVTFPLVLNIFLITLSIGFRGTPFITGGMLLAATFLVCWDYHRLKAIIWPGAAPAVGGAGGIDSTAPPPIGRLEMAGYVIGTTCGLGVFTALRSLIPTETVVPLLVGGGAAGLMVLAAWIRETAARAPSPLSHTDTRDTSPTHDDRPRLAVRIGTAWLLAFVALGLAGWTGEYVQSSFGFSYYARYGLQALIMTGLIVPGILWMRRRLDRAPLAGLGLPDLGTSVRSAAIGMSFIALPLIAIVVLAQLFGWADVSFNTGDGVLGAALFGVFTVIFYEAVPEELAFRGYIYRNLNTRMSRWAAGAVAVALFVLLPILLVTFEERALGMDVVVGGASGLTGGYLITMAIFGSFVQYLRILTGTIWTSVGFHFAFVYINRLIGPGPNDLIQFSDVTAPGAMQITAIAIVGLFFIGALAYPWIRGRPIGWKGVLPEPEAA